MTVFKSQFHKLRFAELWNAKPDDVDRRIFAREVFNCVLGYFLVSRHTFAIKLGALYTLYYLYETQPSSSNEQKAKIPLTPHVFYELLLLREEIKANAIYDAFHCLNRLALLKAFVYTMHTNIDIVISCIDPPTELVPDVAHFDKAMKEKWNWSQFALMIKEEEEFWKSKEKFFGYLKESHVDDEEMMIDVEQEHEQSVRIHGASAQGAVEHSGANAAHRAHPFSRLSQNLIKDIKESIDDQMVQREEQLKLYRNHAILDAKRDMYASIEQLAMHPERARTRVPAGALPTNRRSSRIAKTFQQHDDEDKEGGIKAEHSDSDENEEGRRISAGAATGKIRRSRQR